MLEEAGKAVGFFAFERGLLPLAQTVGGWLNDYSAVIAEPGVGWDPVQILRGSGLVACRFRSLIASQSPSLTLCEASEISPFIDVTRGYEAYEEDKVRSGSALIPRIAAIERRFARDAGPLRFEFHDADMRHLHALIRWKSDTQPFYREAFAHHWFRAWIEDVHATRTKEFGGVLSVLYAGDEMAAAQMGLRSGGTWQYMFPAYNRKFARYSPGMILLRRMVQEAPRREIDRIELGTGEYWYKSRFMTGAHTLAFGAIDTHRVLTRARRVRRSTLEWIRASPLGAPAKLALRALRTLNKPLAD